MNVNMYEMTGWANLSYEYERSFVRVKEYGEVTNVHPIVPMNKLEQRGALTLVHDVLNIYEKRNGVNLTPFEELYKGTYTFNNKIKLCPTRILETDVAEIVELEFVFRLEDIDDIFGLVRRCSDGKQRVVKFKL